MEELHAGKASSAQLKTLLEFEQHEVSKEQKPKSNKQWEHNRFLEAWENSIHTFGITSKMHSPRLDSSASNSFGTEALF